MTQIMFETFSVPIINMALQAVFLYASCRTTDNMVISADGVCVCRTGPTFEGFAWAHAILSSWLEQQ